MQLENQKVAFTGILNTMTRKQAQQLLSAFGIEAQSYLTTETTALIIGSIPTNLFNKDTRTKKLIAAERYIARGQSIVFLTELDFLTSIELALLQRISSVNS